LLDGYRSSYGAIVSTPTSDYGKNWEEEIQKVDSALPKCQCGGSFAYMNPPRCPKCAGLVFGAVYEGKPVLKAREGYTFVSRKTYKMDDLKPRKAEQVAAADAGL
jgi:hypothetical protein